MLEGLETESITSLAAELLSLESPQFTVWNMELEGEKTRAGVCAVCSQLSFEQLLVVFRPVVSSLSSSF